MRRRAASDGIDSSSHDGAVGDINCRVLFRPERLPVSRGLSVCQCAEEVRTQSVFGNAERSKHPSSGKGQREIKTASRLLNWIVRRFGQLANPACANRDWQGATGARRCISFRRTVDVSTNLALWFECGQEKMKRRERRRMKMQARKISTVCFSRR